MKLTFKLNMEINTAVEFHEKTICTPDGVKRSYFDAVDDPRINVNIDASAEVDASAEEMMGNVNMIESLISRFSSEFSSAVMPAAKKTKNTSAPTTTASSSDDDEINALKHECGLSLRYINDDIQAIRGNRRVSKERIRAHATRAIRNAQSAAVKDPDNMYGLKGLSEDIIGELNRLVDCI